MEGVLKSEIFFFIASVALVIVSLVLVVVFVYAMRILRDLKDISGMAKRQAEILSEDLQDLRMKVKNEGSLWGGLKTFWTSLFGKGKGRKRND